jgi:glycine cleavage system aminomethyltransferase T
VSRERVTRRGVLIAGSEAPARPDPDEGRLPPPLLFHEEPILRAGKRVGSITSGAWGYCVNAPLGMGYVTAVEDIDSAWLAAEPFEVEVAWQRYPAQAQLAPWCDPKGT